MLELAGEIGDMPPGILSHNEHLSQVSFGLRMTLEAVLISALFFADLAVPSKALEALRFHLISQVLWRSD